MRILQQLGTLAPKRSAILEPWAPRVNATCVSHTFTEQGSTLKGNMTCDHLKTNTAAATAEYFAAADLVCAVAAAKHFVRVYCRPVHLTKESERLRPDLRRLQQKG